MSTKLKLWARSGLLSGLIPLVRTPVTGQLMVQTSCGAHPILMSPGYDTDTARMISLWTESRGARFMPWYSKDVG